MVRHWNRLSRVTIPGVKRCVDVVLGSAGFIVGFGDLRSLFQPQFCDAIKTREKNPKIYLLLKPIPDHLVTYLSSSLDTSQCAISARQQWHFMLLPNYTSNPNLFRCRVLLKLLVL